MCQLSATQSEKKYEKEGGPGIAECAMLIRKYSSQPAVDLRNFVNWIFFNLYVGNNDSHAKNLSIYRLPDKRVILTPFYDLMCTRIYPGLSQEFAFAVGGEVMPGNITRQHIEEMARQLGMRPAFVYKSAKDLADKLPAAIDQAIDVLQPDMTPNAQTFITRLRKFVISTMKKTVVRISEQEKKIS
jgi:serine/threonine-protein kinase HipA